MGIAIAEILPLAIAKIVSPLSIAVVITLLSAPRGIRVALAFLAAWLSCTLAVCAAMLALVGEGRLLPRPVSPTVLGTVQLALGVLFLGIAVRQWLKRRSAAPGDLAPRVPGWIRQLDNVNIGYGALLGVILGAIGPKNLALEFLAVATVHDAHLDNAQATIVLGIFALLGTLGVAAPVIATYRFGERSARVLDRWRSWLLTNNNLLIPALLLVVGTYFVVDGLGELLG